MNSEKETLSLPSFPSSLLSSSSLPSSSLLLFLSPSLPLYLPSYFPLPPSLSLPLSSLSLSFSHIRSRAGIYVHYLIPGSKAEECGQIHPGDRILEANGRDLRHATVDEAAMFMSVGN